MNVLTADILVKKLHFLQMRPKVSSISSGISKEAFLYFIVQCKWKENFYLIIVALDGSLVV